MFVSPGAGAPSKYVAPPYPIRSMIRVSFPFAAHVSAVLQPSVVTPFASATLPALADMLIGVGSSRKGVGRGAPTAALFVASRTSRYLPGRIEPLSSVSCVAFAPRLPLPVALAYCSDLPSSETEAVPRLKISM